MTSTRFCVSILLLAGSLLGQPLIYEGGVVNNASYALPGLPNSAIARGSLFAIFGENLAPAGGATASEFPLPTAEGLAGTSVQVIADGVSIDAIMVYTSPSQVGVILPSNTPAGRQTLTVTYNGETSAPVEFTVVDSSFGIFTRNQRGSGPAIAQNVNSETDRPINSLGDVARRGQVMILWGTGLGPVTFDETQLPVAGDLDLPVEVIVGDRPAEILYQGRSGCCGGVDQIVFKVPADVEGCYVPLILKIGNTVSNFTTISVAASGNACEDEHGLTMPEIEFAKTSGRFRLGYINLFRFGVEVEIPLLGRITTLTDLGRARFSSYTWEELQQTLGPSFLSATGTCWLAPYRGLLPEQVDPVTGQLLDAGAALSIASSAETKDMPRILDGVRAGEYEGELGGGGLAGGGTSGFLEPGAFRVSGPAGTDVGPIGATLGIPAPPVWENAADISEIDRSQDLEVTWTPGDPSATVAITGSSANPDTEAGVAFACNVPADRGRFTVPSYILLSLPPGGGNALSPSAFLLVGEYGPPTQFSAEGLDAGIFTYVVVNGKTVVYR